MNIDVSTRRADGSTQITEDVICVNAHVAPDDQVEATVVGSVHIGHLNVWFDLEDLDVARAVRAALDHVIIALES